MKRAFFCGLLVFTLNVTAQDYLSNTKQFFSDLLIRKVQETKSTPGYSQTVVVNDTLGFTYVRTFDNSKSDTVFIPFCSIAGITEDYNLQLVSFHLKGGAIVEIPMVLGTVRNVKGRMILEIRKVVSSSQSICSYAKLNHENAKSIVEAAVFEELVRINIQEEIANKVSEDQPLFVKKCNICAGSQKAFKNYVRFYETNSGVETDLPKIQSINLEERLSALEELVARSIDNYFQLHAYTDSEIIHYREMIKMERQRSMAMTNGKLCASCDGACKLPGTN
jgi:hypothetical protein